jgi:hypothetical protein
MIVSRDPLVLINYNSVRHVLIHIVDPNLIQFALIILMT